MHHPRIKQKSGITALRPERRGDDGTRTHDPLLANGDRTAWMLGLFKRLCRSARPWTSVGIAENR